jgi:hypothetical protein
VFTKNQRNTIAKYHNAHVEEEVSSEDSDQHFGHLMKKDDEDLKK